MESPANENDPWEVFGYEVGMFFSLCDLIKGGILVHTADPGVVNNAITESAVLHARQVVDILLSRGGEEDDIKLRDLVPGFTPSSS